MRLYQDILYFQYLFLGTNSALNLSNRNTAKDEAMNPTAYLTISSWWKYGNSLSQLRNSWRISNSFEILSESLSNDRIFLMNLVGFMKRYIQREDDCKRICFDTPDYCASIHWLTNCLHQHLYLALKYQLRSRRFYPPPERVLPVIWKTYGTRDLVGKWWCD